ENRIVVWINRGRGLLAAVGTRLTTRKWALRGPTRLAVCPSASDLQGELLAFEPVFSRRHLLGEPSDELRHPLMLEGDAGRRVSQEASQLLEFSRACLNIVKPPRRRHAAQPDTRTLPTAEPGAPEGELLLGVGCEAREIGQSLNPRRVLDTLDH